jgi:hypothetical protein
MSMMLSWKPDLATKMDGRVVVIELWSWYLRKSQTIAEKL